MSAFCSVHADVSLRGEKKPVNLHYALYSSS